MTAPTRGSVNYLLIGFLLFLVGMMSYRFLIEKTNLFGSSVNSRPVTPAGNLAEDEKSTISLFKNASPSVVSVKTSAFVRDRRIGTREVDAGEGSGLVWDREGHIVTNYHVIAGAIQQQDRDGVPVFGACTVTFSDGSEWDAQIHSFAHEFDLAVLKLTDTPPSRLTPLAIGKSEDLQVGQKVFAIGSPFGLQQTLTTGIISGVGRNLMSEQGGSSMLDMIQTDAAINPGNSGGPLLDSSGLMVGVNTLIYSPATASSGSGQSAGVGFAVPIDTVNLVVPELIRGGWGTRPGLGVSLFSNEFVSTNAPKFKGAIIRKVALGSSAYKAKLRPGDAITGVDGDEVADGEALVANLSDREIGDPVVLTVLRGEQQFKVQITVQAILDTSSFLERITEGEVGR